MQSPGTRLGNLLPQKTFQSVYPKGIELSADVVDLLEDKRKSKTAIAFDEITLEDKPSDFHPNDINLHSFVTRKILLRVVLCSLQQWTQ